MDLQSIHEIFQNRILRIPSYQRGYSWANNKLPDLSKDEPDKNIKGQLMDLWNDIVNIPENRWHYTGLLTLVRSPDSDYPWLRYHNQYSIVDGQQRITSVLILISVMAEYAKQMDLEFGEREGDTQYQYLYIQKSGLHAYLFGYDKDNPSDKFFRKHILGLNEVEDDSKESSYTENLKNAKAFFEIKVNQYIGSSPDREQLLLSLFTTVTSNLRFNEYVLPSELDEYVVFETMNNRGKPLSQLEKLKNRLMYLADKFDISANDKEEKSALLKAHKERFENSINKSWITVYQSLGANKEHPLNDEFFVKNHWIMYFDRYKRSEANVYSNHLFDECFTIEKVYNKGLLPEDVLSYVKSLQDSAVIWNKIHHPHFFTVNERAIKLAIRGLHRVGFRSSFKPLVLATICKSSSQEVLTLLKLLESYAFKIFYISDRQSNTGDSKLYWLAAQVFKGAMSIHQACDHISGHMNYYYKFTLFRSQIEELFETGDMRGFFNWSGLRYFLFEFDNDLRKNNKTTTAASALNWADFNQKNTVEHIYPQSAAKSYGKFCEGNDNDKRKKAYHTLQSNWSEFEIYTPPERLRLCNSLGNLLAISNSDNASFSNAKFSFKVDQSNKGDGYKNRGYRYDSMSAQLIATKENWTPETVKNRGIDMIDTMLSFLGESHDLISENEKIKLLGLEFMIQGTTEVTNND